MMDERFKPLMEILTFACDSLETRPTFAIALTADMFEGVKRLSNSEARNVLAAFRELEQPPQPPGDWERRLAEEVGALTNLTHGVQITAIAETIARHVAPLREENEQLRAKVDELECTLGDEEASGIERVEMIRRLREERDKLASMLKESIAEIDVAYQRAGFVRMATSTQRLAWEAAIAAAEQKEPT